MTRTVDMAVTLTQVDASTLHGTVDHYEVTFTEAGGQVVTTSIPVDATSASVTLAAGSWTASIAAVDASGTALSAPVVGEPSPLVVTDPVVVYVNVPSALALSVA